MKIPLLLFTCLSFLVCGCTSCEDRSCAGEIDFELPLYVYGVKDTIYVDDTLRIRLDIPDKMSDPFSESVSEYSFINYVFRLVTYMVKLDTTPAQSNPKNSFDWVTLKGESKDADSVFIVLPQYINNTYQYEAQIILKQKGLFLFGLKSTADYKNELARVESEICSNRLAFVHAKLANQYNVNFEFLKQSPDSLQANTNRQLFNRSAGFCFYVR